MLKVNGYRNQFLNGVHAGLVIEAEDDKGRTASVLLDQDTFMAIAKIMETTKHLGHAVWHYTNPDREFPCETCHH